MDLMITGMCVYSKSNRIIIIDYNNNAKIKFLNFSLPGISSYSLICSKLPSSEEILEATKAQKNPCDGAETFRREALCGRNWLSGFALFWPHREKRQCLEQRPWTAARVPQLHGAGPQTALLSGAHCSFYAPTHCSIDARLARLRTHRRPRSERHAGPDKTSQTNKPTVRIRVGLLSLPNTHRAVGQYRLISHTSSSSEETLQTSRDETLKPTDQLKKDKLTAKRQAANLKPQGASKVQ